MQNGVKKSGTLDIFRSRVSLGQPGAQGAGAPFLCVKTEWWCAADMSKIHVKDIITRFCIDGYC